MNNKKLSHSEFKTIARRHQIKFKTTSKEEGGLGIEPFPVRHIHRKNKEGQVIKKTAEVMSSLCDGDEIDTCGNYVIFYDGFRKEITEAIHQRTKKGNCSSNCKSTSSQMMTNLLRSEHIPYNVFFPMKTEYKGTAELFNDILGSDRIERITDIKIEYTPVKTDETSSREIPLLGDGTAFDVYVEYIPKNGQSGQKGGIGIEVKYTEKEYPLKAGSKEYKETHDTKGIHLADNYRIPSYEIGWFKPEYLMDVPKEDTAKSKSHLVADKFRQIWRNHLLGGAMILNGDLSEFTSLTVFPEGNGHFRDEGDDSLWSEYNSKLTEEGKLTLKYMTFESLFSKMRKHFNFQGAKDWVDYLEKRYIPS